MKKSRLFFSVFFVAFLVIATIPSSVFSQPALPDNEYSGVANTDLTSTDAFSIEVVYDQYWQGQPFQLTITKNEDVVLEESVLLSVKPVGSGWDEAEWVGFDYNDNKNIVFPPNGVQTHLEYFNNLAVGDSLSVMVYPGSPRGPLRFYQPKQQDVRLGFYYKAEETDSDPTLFVSNQDSFVVLSEHVTYDSIREDAIYLEGESVSITISDLPIGYMVDKSDSVIFNGSNPLVDSDDQTLFSHVRVHFVACDTTGCEIKPIFENQENSFLDFENVSTGEIEFSGVIDPALGQVTLGYVVELATSSEGFKEPLTYEFNDEYHVLGLFDDSTIGSKMYTLCPNQALECDMPLPIIANFGLVAVEGIVLPNLSDQTNLYNTDKVFQLKKKVLERLLLIQD